MRIVLDTNVWIAAFLTHGGCHELLEYSLETHTLLISDEILEEIEEKLAGKFRFAEKRVSETLTFIRDNTERVQGTPLPKPLCRDPDDDRVLAAAAGGGADCLVTGDDDLLVLKEFQKIPILKPGQFWEFEKKYQGDPDA